MKTRFLIIENQKYNKIQNVLKALTTLSIVFFMFCLSEIYCNPSTQIFNKSQITHTKKNKTYRIAITDFQLLGGDDRYALLKRSLPDLLAVSLIQNKNFEFLFIKVDSLNSSILLRSRPFSSLKRSKYSLISFSKSSIRGADFSLNQDSRVERLIFLKIGFFLNILSKNPIKDHNNFSLNYFSFQIEIIL